MSASSPTTIGARSGHGRAEHGELLLSAMADTGDSATYCTELTRGATGSPRGLQPRYCHRERRLYHRGRTEEDGAMASCCGEEASRDDGGDEVADGDAAARS